MGHLSYAEKERKRERTKIFYKGGSVREREREREKKKEGKKLTEGKSL